MFIPNLFIISRKKLLASLITPFLMTSQDENTLITQKNNKLYFTGQLSSESCFNLQLTLDNMINNDKIENIQFYLQTNGGSLLPTFPVVDLIKGSPKPIDTHINGYCASAGTLLSVVGNKRYMTNNSLFLIHSLRQEGIGGNYNNIKDIYYNSNTIMDLIKQIYLDNTNITEQELEYYLEHDLWLTAKECLKYNIIDEIS